MRLAVLGCGSIGTRHAKNIAQIGGHKLVLHDSDRSKAESLSNATGASVARTIDEALSSNPDAVLICTPPESHAALAAKALESGAHCFVEKPLAIDHDSALHVTELAEKRELVLMVGFNLRFHPGLIKTHELVTNGSIGRVMMVRAEFGQYLPDWRPTTNYRDNYIVNKETGGGIVREESHETDYVQWLGGPIQDVYTAAGQLSDLDMTAEDSALMIMRLESGALAELHVDCVQRGYSRKCTVIGTAGTAEWVYETGVTLTHGQDDTTTFDISPDPNDMYVDEITHFFKCCEGNATPPVDGRSALATMRVIEAAHRSITSHKAETVL